MTEDLQIPAWPRPATQSPSRPPRGTLSHKPPPVSISTRKGVPSEAPMLSTTSNNRSLHSFGRNGNSAQQDDDNLTYDFLPSVSFDDLQTSVESASSDFLADFPSPTGYGSILEGQTNGSRSKMPEKSAIIVDGGPMREVTIPQPANRPGRSGSTLRRPSTSSRQPSVSSLSSFTGQNDSASTTVASTRSRRQSHYPPVSNVNMGIAKRPRKSVGPGIITDFETQSHTAQRRRPSFRADPNSADTTRTSMDGSSSDTPRSFADTTRAAKARSVQPPSRSQTSNFIGANLTPDPSRLSTLTPRSPRVNMRDTTPSSTSKRASMLPPGHHASGLGARTISPTDTRRMKRLSTMPQSQSLNQIASQIASLPPPPQVSADSRSESRSPSMIPRKLSATPSSARTTPELHNKKSQSSALSIASSTSWNNPRTSSSSIQQQRLPQSSTTSRLPAPKHTTVHSAASTEEEEDVPPVPAIPKAYESPKEGPAGDAYFEKKKSTLGDQGTSAHRSVSNGDITMPVVPEPTKEQRKGATRKVSSNSKGENEQSTSSKKQLPPLSLPPLNLGPLSLPTTTTKVNKHYETGIKTPPPAHAIPKTPTTPMTASKSSFFSKSTYDETIELPPIRSSSSIHHTRQLTPSPTGISSSLSSLEGPSRKASLSPFLSSSLPKGGTEHNFLKRSKTGGDFAATFFNEQDVHKPEAAPRSKVDKRSVSPPPAPESIPEEAPQTPSSMSNLRRKLSMTWKRGSSKSGISMAAEVASDKQNPMPPSRHDSMPPPKLPISATAGNLSGAKHASPSPAVKPAIGGYLDSRRKSSSASLSNNFTHDRKKSDTSKKDGPDTTTYSTTRNPVTMSRMLKPKGSTAGMRGTEFYTADLDKDDMAAEEEMRKLGSRRKDTEIAARTLDALKKRATQKERVGPHEAIRIAMLNIYERGEIVDYPDIFFCGTQNAHKVVGDLHSEAPNFGYDDERGDYNIVAGDHLAYRYEVIDVLGKGSFGQVVRCIDHKLGVLVAVKIIRNKKRFHQQALVEVNILQKLREWDPKNKYSMVNFTQSFYFRGHLCISTELLDMNLFELIKAHSFRGFSLRIVRRFTKQILASLNILKQKKVIHCDLKPENILLRHPLHAEIKVIDFGSSCFENEKVYTYIQSRFYRSPEVILGMTYGMPIDMWSVGCILAELFTGIPIFPGENEQEQLACIMEVFGPPEKHLIEKSTRKKLFFDSMGKPRLTVSTKGKRRRPSSKTLQSVLKCDDEAFLDFIARCLRWDPERRLKPEDAIRHEFITGIKRPPRQSIAPRELSPVKRTITGSGPRPLPEPPGSTISSKATTQLRGGPSPHKTVAGGTRRVSGVTAPTASSVNKRTSAGSGGLGSAGTSGLPRASGRTASGKQDLAAAGASAAMNRRT